MEMPRNVCIVGGGSIGGVLAYFLYKGGLFNIPVYYRSETSVKSILDTRGILIRIPHQREVYLVPIQPRISSNPVDECDFIINSVKAYDVEATIDLMKKLSHGGTVIIMLQNGIGSYELVAEKLANVKVAVGVAFIGSERDSPSSITYSGGKTIITGCPGRICYELKELQTVFIRGGCDFRITSNIDYYRWLKLALNSIVNPITALTRKRNKIILDEDAGELVDQLIEEFIQVAKKYGFSFEKEGLVSYIIRNVELTRENKSSMLQDILRKKRTEIDYINGFLARELGRGSLNFFITRLIHLLEVEENGE